MSVKPLKIHSLLRGSEQYQGYFTNLNQSFNDNVCGLWKPKWRKTEIWECTMQNFKKCEFWVHRSQNIHKGKGSLYNRGCQHNKLNSKQKGYKTKFNLQWCNKINSYKTQRSHYSIPPNPSKFVSPSHIHHVYTFEEYIFRLSDEACSYTYMHVCSADKSMRTVGWQALHQNALPHN